MTWKKLLGYGALGAGLYGLHECINRVPLYKPLALAFGIPLAMIAGTHPRTTANIAIEATAAVAKCTAKGAREAYGFVSREIAESGKKAQESQNQDIRIKTLEAKLSATPTSVPTATPIPQAQSKISRSFQMYPMCDNLIYCNRSDLYVSLFRKDGSSAESTFPCTMGSDMPLGLYEIRQVMTKGHNGTPLYSGNTQILLDKDKLTEMLIGDDGNGFWTGSFIFPKAHIPENNIVLSHESMQGLIARIFPNQEPTYQKTKVLIDG